MEIAPDTRHLAGAVRTIITSLPKPAALEATVATIADAGLRPIVVIETSTFALADKLEAARTLKSGEDHIMLGCPISGTSAQAKHGQDIVVYAGGDPQSNQAAARGLRRLRAARPIASAPLGQWQPHEISPSPTCWSPSTTWRRRRGSMVLGIKGRASAPQTIYDMVTSGAGNSRIFELRAPMMVRNRYDDPTMKVAIWQKDMQVIGEFAAALADRSTAVQRHATDL